MAHGQPDFGIYAPKTTVYAESDVGELAARLNSIVTYDRRGDVIFLDDFEAPVLKWDTTVAGVGYVRLDSTNVRAGGQAVRLHTNAAAGPNTAMFKYLFLVGARRMGIEVHFSRPANTYNINVHLYDDDGVAALDAHAVIDIAAGTLGIRSTGGGAVPLAAGLTFPDDPHCFIPIKIVADFSTGYYVRVLLGNVEYDASLIPLYAHGSIATARETPGVYLTNDFTAAEADLWLDAVILTRDEP